jgi:plastocyanin
MTANTQKKSNPDTTRYMIIAALVVAAFFGAYRFAQASNSQGSSGVANAASQIGLAAPAGAAGAGSAGAAAGGGGCCGGGSGTPVKGTAKVEGGVQRISVDAARGYNPNTIQLKAGVPAEITFSQSAGCTAIVQSSDLGFQEDLSSGPKTIKLKGLAAGTYNFACGMNMVRGTIVVQ